ncbi:molybdenum cofactor guanylyltransferase [Candidatus Poriferisodalis sp.]|uniref:molybdenum cofactor guanylyltransferase n=1 Tax=Candidatus Poriferisodalis sp. TaxID=3101277 RepID=UPI003B5A59F7
MSPAGVVLCGGASTRMGSDKSTLEVAGRPLALWVAEALRAAGAHPVVAQGGRPPPPLVAETDSTPGAGPLGGLVDALERHGDVLVCPTDVPTVPPDLLVALVELARQTGAPVVLARSDRLEPLIGHYARESLPALRAGLRAGARGPKAVLDNTSVPTVPVAAADVLNVNTSADLATAEAILSARSVTGPQAP